jgi:hypothetical protein
MMDERPTKRRLWPWIVIGVLFIAYPLSYPMAVHAYVATTGDVLTERPAAAVVIGFYWLLHFVIGVAPEPIQKAFMEYHFWYTMIGLKNPTR